VAAQVAHAGLERLQIFLLEIVLLHAAVHFQRADGGDEHDAGGLEAGLAALDVENFSPPRSAPKPASVTT
jgi:hypothetical protein